MIDTSALPLKVEFGGRTKRGDCDCFQWNCTVQTAVGFWNFPYYCGLGHVTKPKHRFGETRPTKPSNDDILSSLILDASAADENFHDWCANYGESDDSIKALNTYKACLETATFLRKHFGAAVIAELREQLADH